MSARTLSVRQPWAWAIIYGGKDVENRTKAPIGTHFLLGSRIVIHAARGMTRAEYESAAEYMSTIGVECPRPDELIRGAVIGSVRLVDVVSERTSQWFFGPRGLVLENPEPCEPKPCKGQLGWFDWESTSRKYPHEQIMPALPWMISWPGGRVQRQVPPDTLPLWEKQHDR